MKTVIRGLALSLSVALLAACSTGTQKPAPIVNGNGLQANQSANSTYSQGVGGSAGLNGSSVASNANDNTIYFSLNRAKISSQYQGVVDHYANYLLSHPDSSIKISGYTDISGSRAWNLSLSQQRAKSVAHALELQGVKKTQISVVGYGEEYSVPACKGKTHCWENRRATVQLG